MQIHELNTLVGKPKPTDYLAIDTGFDTAKISADKLMESKVNQPLNASEQPDPGNPGQLLRTNGDGSTEWTDAGLPTDEQTAQAVSDWLDAHPEATTTVADGSLTAAKFTDQLKHDTLNDYATPEMYGAVGDGVEDDTAAIQAALDNNEYVVLSKDYLVSGTLSIPNQRVVEFAGYSTIHFTGNGACLYANNPRRLKIKNARLMSAGRVGIGILLEEARNVEIISPRITEFDTGIKIDGLGTWSASNVIFDPFIYKFNTGLLLTANSGKQTNDTKVFGGYIIDEANSDAICVKVEAACDTNYFFGVAVEDAGTGFYNGSGSPYPMMLFGCRAENMKTYNLNNNQACQGLLTFGCNFDIDNAKVRMTAAWQQNVDGKNIEKSYFKSGPLNYYDSGNTKRSWLRVETNGLSIGPRGSNKVLTLQGTGSDQTITDYIRLGGANGLMFPVRGFIMKSATSGSSKYFKITVNDSGQLSATEVTPT